LARGKKTTDCRVEDETEEQGCDKEGGTKWFSPGDVFHVEENDGIMKSYSHKNLMEIVVKNVVFWDITPCGFCKNRRFGGT
jgi:hypothetical protein